MDDIDSIIAGKNFEIRYLGRMGFSENDDCNFSEIAGEVFSQYSRDSLKHLPRFDIVIDSTSVEIIDGYGFVEPKVLFDVPLLNVKNILYRNGNNRYGNICILVAREISECSLKAHVLLCNDSQTTGNIFRTFERAFAFINKTKKTNAGLYGLHDE